MDAKIYYLTEDELRTTLEKTLLLRRSLGVDDGIVIDEIVADLDTEAFDKAFEHPVHESDDDMPYVGEDAERADTAYDQWLHDMGQGA